MSNVVESPKKGSLTNRNANFPLNRLWFDDFFTSDFSSLFTSNFNEGITVPKVNIKENESSFDIDFAIPGLNKSDFQIDIDNNILSIATEFEKNTEQEEDAFKRREFGYSSFKRSFSLPENIDSKNIKANYVAGILNVYLPKKEKSKRKTVRSIKVS